MKIKALLLGALLTPIAFAQTLLISVEVENGVHSISDVSITPRDYPATVSDQPQAGSLHFRLSNDAGEVLYQGFMDQPGQLIKEHIVANEDELHLTGESYLPNAFYTLRLPYDAEFLQLDIEQISQISLNNDDGQGPSQNRVLTQNLQNLLNQ